MREIDWSVFGPVVTTTCYCRCGAVYRSHAKVTYEQGARSFSKDPCPGCGHCDRLRRISSDPESFIMRGHNP